MIAGPLLALLAAPAWAQDLPALPALSTSTLRPAPAAERAIALPSAAIEPGWTARADLQVLRNPLVYRADDGTTTSLLGWVAQVDLGAAWEVGNLRLSGSAPAILRYAGEGGEGAALGDPGLDLLVSLLPREAPLALGLQGGLTLPLGASAVALGETGPTGQAGLLVDGGWGPAWGAAQAGVRLRPQQDAPGLTLDEALLLRAALAVRVVGDTHLAAELLSETALTAPYAAAETSPAELLLSAAHRRPAGTGLRLGVGLGLVPAVGAPTWRLLLGVGQDSVGPGSAGPDSAGPGSVGPGGA